MAPRSECETRDYGLAVPLSADTDEIYANVSLRLRQRTRLGRGADPTDCHLTRHGAFDLEARSGAFRALN